MLRFHCMACRDTQPVTFERRHCLCGRAYAWASGDTIVVAGPGRVSTQTSVVRDEDEVPVYRPSFAVGT